MTELLPPPLDGALTRTSRHSVFETSAERSARVSKQLRDKYGKFIEMGGGIRWSGSNGTEYSGIAESIKGNNVVVRDVKYKRANGQTGSLPNTASVPGNTVEASPKPKATLDAPAESNELPPAGVTTAPVEPQAASAYHGAGFTSPQFGRMPTNAVVSVGGGPHAGSWKKDRDGKWTSGKKTITTSVLASWGARPNGLEPNTPESPEAAWNAYVARQTDGGLTSEQLDALPESSEVRTTDGVKRRYVKDANGLWVVQASDMEKGMNKLKNYTSEDLQLHKAVSNNDNGDPETQPAEQPPAAVSNPELEPYGSPDAPGTTAPQAQAPDPEPVAEPAPVDDAPAPPAQTTIAKADWDADGLTAVIDQHESALFDANDYTDRGQRAYNSLFSAVDGMKDPNLSDAQVTQRLNDVRDNMNALWDEAETADPDDINVEGIQDMTIDVNDWVDAELKRVSDGQSSDVSAPTPTQQTPDDEIEEPSADEPGPVNNSNDSLPGDVDGSQPLDISGWTKVSGAQGSNPGNVYEDPDGNRWYVKQSATDDHARNEVLARKLYDLAGVESAQLQLADVGGGKLGTASPLIPGATQDLRDRIKDPEYKNKLQEGFAVDAWLANWDVGGRVYDNVVTDSNGDPVRVDPGGALLFRAQGAPKGDAFGKNAGEWETLRDGSNAVANNLFGDMTNDQLRDSADLVGAISDEQIDEAIDSMGFPEELSNRLKFRLPARRDSIVKRADALPRDVAEVDAPTPVTPTPDVSDADSTSDGDASKFEVLDDPGTPGDGYFPGAPGKWGKYGAAGVMVRHTDENGVERYLLVERGPIVSSNKGKWQLPGGALNSKENDYQGTARELSEELSPPDGYLGGLKPAGEVRFDDPSGWHYTNIAADVDEQFEPVVDGTETSAAGWYTREEIAKLPLHPALASNLDNIFGKFTSPGTTESREPLDAPDEQVDSVGFPVGGQITPDELPDTDTTQGFDTGDSEPPPISNDEFESSMFEAAGYGLDSPAATPNAAPAANDTLPQHTFGDKPLVDPDGNRYVSDMNGAAVRVGDRVENTSKGYTGTVVGLENNGKFTRVLTDHDGKVHGLNNSKIFKSEASAAPNAAASADEADLDASAPTEPEPSPPAALKKGDLLVSVDELESLPAGSSIRVVHEPGYVDFYTKTATGDWIDDEGTSTLPPLQFTDDLNGNGVYLDEVGDGSYQAGNPDLDTVATLDDLNALPVGTEIEIASGAGAGSPPLFVLTKAADGTWREPGSEEPVLLNDNDYNTYVNNGMIGVTALGAEPPGDVPDSVVDKYQPGSKAASADDLYAAAAGTEITSQDANGQVVDWFVKDDVGFWMSNINGWANLPSYFFSTAIESGSITYGTPSDVDAGENPITPGSIVTGPQQLDLLGAGSIVAVYSTAQGAAPTLYLKKSDGNWQFMNPDSYQAGTPSSSFTHPFEHASMKIVSVEPVFDPAQSQGTSQDTPVNSTLDLHNAPSGTIFHTTDGSFFSKQPNDYWWNGADGAYYTVNDLAYTINNGGATFGIPAPTSSNTAPSVPDTVPETETPSALPAHTLGQSPLFDPTDFKPYVTAANGVNIKVGSSVTSKSFGWTGTVVGIESNGTHVRVRRPDGSIGGLSLKKLDGTDSAATASPAVANPQPSDPATTAPSAPAAPKSDPSSPFFGQPRPAQPAEPTLVANPQYVDSDFQSNMEAHYANVLNKSKSLQQSYYWPRIQDVMTNGDLSNLEFLHNKNYISDADYNKTVAKILSVKSAHQSAVADYATARAQHAKDVAEWKRANGIQASDFTVGQFTLRGMTDDVVSHTDNDQAKMYWSGFSKKKSQYPAPVAATIQKYVAGSYSLNANLRQTGIATVSPTYTPLSGANSLKNMDRAMTYAARTQDDVMVHRGADYWDWTLPDQTNPDNSRTDFLAKVKPGAVVTDYGFGSTSIGKDAKFGHKQVQMHIRVPKGYKGVLVQSSGFSGGLANSEREYILNRGTTYYVHDVRSDGGQVHVDLEIVPVGWTPEQGALNEQSQIPTSAAVPAAGPTL